MLIPSRRRPERKKKRKKSKSTANDTDTYSRHTESTTKFPEDAEGGLYGADTGASAGGSRGTSEAHGNGHAMAAQNEDNIFTHEF